MVSGSVSGPRSVTVEERFGPGVVRAVLGLVAAGATCGSMAGSGPGARFGMRS